MADNEQELLSDKEIDRLISGMPFTPTTRRGWINTIKRINKYHQAKLKAMGYVKWDREKVAGKCYQLYKETFGELASENTGQYLEVADQLKEILTER